MSGWKSLILLQRTYESGTLSAKLSAKQSAFKALSEDEQAKAKEKAKKLAEEVLQKAKDGEDFKKLIEKYGWDPGMESSPDGYYINKNTSFVQRVQKTHHSNLKKIKLAGLLRTTAMAGSLSSVYRLTWIMLTNILKT